MVTVTVGEDDRRFGESHLRLVIKDIGNNFIAASFDFGDKAIELIDINWGMGQNLVGTIEQTI